MRWSRVDAVQPAPDAVLAALLAVLGLVELIVMDEFARGSSTVQLAVVLGMTIPLAVRRRWPLATLGVVAGLFAGQAIVLAAPPEVLAEAVAMLLAVYSVAAHVAPRVSATAAAFALMAGLVRGLGDSSYTTGTAVTNALWVLPAWVVGLMVHRYERRAVTADLRAAEASEAERLRIARELHDVVAHGIGVMVLHARGGRRNLDADPEAARQALDTITSVGEQALAEMRRALGVLRTEAVDRAPAPGLSGLPELLRTFRDAGLPCDLEADELPELSPSLQLSVYRIVQECLTNAARHGGVAALVRLRVRGPDLCLEVTDEGGGQDLGPGTGNGLAGIRERAQMFGGTASAGPAPGGGFRVLVLVPLRQGVP